MTDVERVVVLGATGTMGRAIVDRLAARGTAVLAVARGAEDLAKLATTNSLVRTFRADISDDAASGEIARALDGPVRMAVFAAGLSMRGSLESIAPSDLATATNTKVAGMLRMVHGVRDHLVEGSRLVAIAGSLGLEPNAAAAGPGVANAGLFNLMRQLSLIWGPRGVTTHTIAPGPIDSPRLHHLAAEASRTRGVPAEDVLRAYVDETSRRRLPTADEIAWMVENLLADEAGALHGGVITIDGGVRHGLA